MLQPAYYLDEERRQIVLEALQQVCSHRQWTLLAAHVRANHVHTVLEADKAAEECLQVVRQPGAQSERTGFGRTQALGASRKHPASLDQGRGDGGSTLRSERAG